MKKRIKKGYVIKDTKSNEYLLDDLSAKFGSILDAQIFKLKKDAKFDIENSGDPDEEVIEKIEITIIAKIL